MHRVAPLVAGLSLLTVGGLITASRLIPSLRAVEQTDTQLMAVLLADDRRDGSEETLGTLRAGTGANDPEIRRLAVRALGRAERADWLTHLNGPLTDPDATVRTAAANAVAQAVYRGTGVDSALQLLTSRLPNERNPEVRGVLVQSLGRLRHGSPEAARQVESVMLDAIAHETDPAALEAAARGFESLARLNRRQGFRLSEAAAARLEELTALGRVGVTNGDSALPLARTRRMSLASLIASERVGRSVLEEAFEAPDAGVRRLAVLGSVAHPDPAVRGELIMRAPADVSAMVRFEIIRAFSSTMMDSEGCVPLTDALDDRSPHVTLQLLDAMAACPADQIVPFLVQVFASLPDRADSTMRNWQHPMRAYMSLVQVAPDLAARALDRPLNHSQWQVRMYAAQAAGVLEQTDALYELADDEHHNVRTAALQGLGNTVRHEADSIYMRELSADDYQLVMTAARQLAGTQQTDESLLALFLSLERITAEERETSRDVRVALMTRIGALGRGGEEADRLRPFLSDFDSVLADSAATILERWTSQDVAATPQPLAHQPFPTLDELREWKNTTATLHMRGLGEIVIGFRPFDAPTNVARFIRLAESGYFDGLTFHRVVPNFVIQGGSPGANEYAGDGAYTRDELTRRGHWRGTVGLSTRGRDTGDGQLFINLVDNVRLDHNYTIFGEVLDGMEVVDLVLEGAVIDSVRITNDE